MEAPEKIYVHVKGDKVTNTWNSAWIGVHDVEYIRTDAFIEKACKWLNNFYNNETRCYLIAEDIQEFKESMKGE